MTREEIREMVLHCDAIGLLRDMAPVLAEIGTGLPGDPYAEEAWNLRDFARRALAIVARAEKMQVQS